MFVSLCKSYVLNFIESADMPLNNVKIAIQNIERLDTAFGENDRADRIYINFCNPWGKNKHKKRRLTHTRQLLNYRKFLKGELWFKTDDDELFEESFECPNHLTGFRFFIIIPYPIHFVKCFGKIFFFLLSFIFNMNIVTAVITDNIETINPLLLFSDGIPKPTENFPDSFLYSIIILQPVRQ